MTQPKLSEVVLSLKVAHKILYFRKERSVFALLVIRNWSWEMKVKHLHTALRFNSNEWSIMGNPKANYRRHTAVAFQAEVKLLGAVMMQNTHGKLQTENWIWVLHTSRFVGGVKNRQRGVVEEYVERRGGYIRYQQDSSRHIWFVLFLVENEFSSSPRKKPKNLYFHAPTPGWKNCRIWYYYHPKIQNKPAK